MVHRLIEYIDPRPEHRFLLACTCLPMPPSAIAQAKLILQEKMDWAYLRRLAEEHGMLWVMQTQIANHFSDVVPSSVAQDLRAQFEQNQFKSLWATSELLRMLARFTEHDLQVLPYKGPVLAESLYGSLAIRRMGDLDLLIRASDYWKVHHVLLAEGYQPDLALADTATIALVRYQCERTFTHREYGIGIDLHWGLWLAHDILPLEHLGLWQRARPTTLAGKSIMAMSPEDTLLLLAIHGTMHHWRGLSWLMDIGQMIRRVNLDWEWVEREASRWGIRRIVWLTAYLAGGLTNVELPASVQTVIEQDTVVTRLAKQICAELFLAPREVPIIEDLPFHLRTRERWADRARVLYSLVTAPSGDDLAWVAIPTWLFPLYRLLRPVRLVAKYARALFGRMFSRRNDHPSTKH
jgi:hypothetical protein